MLSSNDDVEDVFFDSIDYIRSCSSVSSEESVSGSVELDYEIWRMEPGSVRERREKFIREMGFSEFEPSISGCSQESDGNVLSDIGLERITECSGAVPSSLGSVSNRGDEVSFCSRRDLDGGAVPSSLGSVSNRGDEVSVSSRRDLDGRIKFMTHDLGQHGSDGHAMGCAFETTNGSSPSSPRQMRREDTVHREKHNGHLDTSKKKIRSWWNHFIHKTMKERKITKSDISKKNHKMPSTNRMKVRHNKKRCMEFTAVYMGQEIQAHKGFIWTMKFSPDGQYLASGGEDGVVRIWQVTSTSASYKYHTSDGTSTFVGQEKESKFVLGRKKSNPASVFIPEKVFKIEELPMQEFHGHTSDVLDLCWSKSNCLLSSSKDKTVRLWQVGCDECLQVFYHNNYVTCVQFNPIDDEYFISGSIDGKVRIWGISESRVVDWANVRDIVTAICYQPDGQGFVVGSITGHCRFYDSSGNNLQLDAHICVQGRKKSSSKRITGFQFSPENSRRVMITSADSKVRIFDGADVIHKYRGLRKSGSQMSASFTSNGRHIISVGEDSRVYVWNYDGLCLPSSKQAKSIRSCEHFFFEGVSVAIPWSRTEPEPMRLGRESLLSSSQTPEQFDTTSLPRDSERFSLGGWFSLDGPSRGSATWPEEKLPLWDVPVAERHHIDHPQQDHHHQHHNHIAPSATWGLVIVTAGWDGMIRTFHNYGLPVRL